jgi:hypothetical protein
MAKELVAEIASEEEELKIEESDLCPTLLIKRGNKVMLFNKNMFLKHLVKILSFSTI